jgi:hypothetical protein
MKQQSFQNKYLKKQCCLCGKIETLGGLSEVGALKKSDMAALKKENKKLMEANLKLNKEIEEKDNLILRLWSKCACLKKENGQ